MSLVKFAESELNRILAGCEDPEDKEMQEPHYLERLSALYVEKYS